MKHGSLFSGIGGFDLAAQWVGWENMFHCEWNPFGQKILKHYWPGAESYEDITKTDFSIWRGRIDILTGGFPCQPYSVAGQRKGKDDERHLWPHMLSAVREIKPRWVVGENVLGLVGWNGGLVFEEVQADLEAEGYEVQPYILPAAAVNAPHRRDRVWFVAYNANAGNEGLREQEICSHGLQNAANSQSSRSIGLSIGAYTEHSKHGELSGDGNATYATSSGLQKSGQTRERKLQKEVGEGLDDRPEFGCSNATDTDGLGLRGETNGLGKSGQPNEDGTSDYWRDFPTQSPIRMRDDGISSQMARYITKELYDEIGKTSKDNRIENLQEVWEYISQEKIWEQVGRLYSLDSKEVLLQTMQLYSSERREQGELSPFSEEVSKSVLLHLRRFREFGRSPRGRRLEKQREEQFGNTLSSLSHEVALAAGRLEASISKFETWHRNESIKAGGNAIVPQVVLQIFKAIEQYENNHR